MPLSTNSDLAAVLLRLDSSSCRENPAKIFDIAVTTGGRGCLSLGVNLSLHHLCSVTVTVKSQVDKIKKREINRNAENLDRLSSDC